MSRAVITLQDEGGAIACRVKFEGGEKEAYSGAHRIAREVIAYLDEHMSRMAGSPRESVPPWIDLPEDGGKQLLENIRALQATPGQAQQG